MAEEYCWATTELCFFFNRADLSLFGFGFELCDWTVFSTQFKMYTNVRLCRMLGNGTALLSRVERASVVQLTDGTAVALVI